MVLDPFCAFRGTELLKMPKKPSHATKTLKMPKQPSHATVPLNREVLKSS
jgi:hypothetical protein